MPLLTRALRTRVTPGAVVHTECAGMGVPKGWFRVFERAQLYFCRLLTFNDRRKRQNVLATIFHVIVCTFMRSRVSNSECMIYMRICAMCVFMCEYVGIPTQYVILLCTWINIIIFPIIICIQQYR